MSQIAWKLDSTTVRKLKKSLLIGTSGFIVSAAGILMADPRVMEYLSHHLLLAAGIASYLPVLINSINEWRKGQIVDEKSADGF